MTELRQEMGAGFTEMGVRFDEVMQRIVEMGELFALAQQAEEKRLLAKIFRLGFRIGQLDCISQTHVGEPFLPIVASQAYLLAREMGVATNEDMQSLIEKVPLWIAEIGSASVQTIFRIGRILGGGHLAGVALIAAAPFPLEVLRKATYARLDACQELLEPAHLPADLLAPMRDVVEQTLRIFEQALSMREKGEGKLDIAKFIDEAMESALNACCERIQSVN